MSARKRHFMGWLALFAYILAGSAGAKPITHEDVWLMPRVGTPVISPDGTKAIVSVTQPAYKRSEQSTDLHLVDLVGDQGVRQLTFTSGGESQVAWSPDSSSIAFVARRRDDEAAQIYVLSLTKGGEAQRLTDQPGGVAEPVFSPQGDRIAFVSQIDPTEQGEEEASIELTVNQLG